MNIGSGASVAYSLRSLTGGDPKVVNVRRSGDTDGNTNEREFTSTEVGTELADWVNGKQETTLPADVASAAAAYSLRKVRSAYTGNAVQVRRTSDNVEVDVAFDSNDEVSTSSAITNVTEETSGSSEGSTTATTLGVFLTEDVEVYASDYSSGVDSWSFSGGSLSAPESIGGEDDALKVTKSSDGFFFPQKTGVLVSGKTYTFNVKLYVPSSNTNSNLNFNVREAGGGTIADCNVSQADAWESFTVSFTSGDGGSGNQILQITSDVSMSDGDVFYIKDFVATQTTDSDAAVVTWYDQSGNGEDATQLTSGDQPLLAESGSLLTSTNGKVAIDLRRTSGSDGPFLLASSVSGLEGSLSMFTLVDFDETGSPLSLSNSTAGNRYFAINEGSTTHQVISRNTTTVTVSDTVTGNERIGFGVTTGQTSTKSSVDGGALVEDTTDYGDDFGAGDLDQILIGALRTVSPTSHFDGHIQELLVYTSDQSSNRFKIESNINNHYDNANYDDTRDGFVETWFDQSGNGNNATQSALDAQPLIVNSGNLIDGGKSFSGDDTEQHLDFGSSITLTDDFSIFYKSDPTDRSCVMGTGTGTTPRFEHATSSVIRFATGVNYDFDVTGTSFSNAVISLVRDSSDSATLNQNGTLKDTETLDSHSSFTFAQLFAFGTNVNQLDGNFSEIIIYDSDLGDTTRSALEDNMKSYYGIS